MATTEEQSQWPVLDRTVYASKDGGTFDVYGKRWKLSSARPKGQIIPDFKEIPPEQKEALLRTLAQRATKYDAGTIKADISTLKAFIKKFKDTDDFVETGIDVENLITWLASTTNDEAKRNFRTTLLEAISLGYGAAFEEGVSEVAKQFKTGRIRLHPDRFEGSRSLTESERKQLYYQLARESHLGHIPNSVRVPVTLIMITGKRPVQTAHSKFKDFSVEEVSLTEGDRRKVVIYNAPVAKQQGQGFRTMFNPMPLVSSFEIWEDLESIRAANKKRLSQIIGTELTEEQSLELPIFLFENDAPIVDRYNSAIQDGLDLDSFLRSDRLHPSPQSISFKLIDLNRYVTIISEFTGRPLRMNAKRFRHTLATNLALSGHSIDEIAYALDHASRWSSRTYVDNLPARAVKIGNQVEETLGVIAKTFLGKTVENPDQVINLFTKNGPQNIGECGLDVFCNENYPIACYECELFNPNPFGNHAAVQDYVETKLQEAKDGGNSRHIENWHTILLAVLERRYVADQQRIQILEEAPQVLCLKHNGLSHE